MKKLLVLGLLIVAPLGCRRDVGAPPPKLREGEVIMMPGAMPKGTPAHLRKAVEGKIQKAGEGPPTQPGAPQPQQQQPK